MSSIIMLKLGIYNYDYAVKFTLITVILPWQYVVCWMYIIGCAQVYKHIEGSRICNLRILLK